MPDSYRLREAKLNRVCEFLLIRPGMALCDECIRGALAVVSRSMLPERSLSENAAKRGFVRERGTCECCGKTVVTTKALQTNTEPGVASASRRSGSVLRIQDSRPEASPATCAETATSRCWRGATQ